MYRITHGCGGILPGYYRAFLYELDSLVTPVGYTSCRRNQRSSRQL